MKQTRRASPRILPTWLAILAIALQGLWPLIAQAKPAAPSLLLPLCSVDGVAHYIELAPSEAPLDERSAVHHEHCQLCVFGSDRVAALPAASIPVLVVETALEDAPLRSFVVSPETPSYLPAQPRAPPAYS